MHLLHPVTAPRERPILFSAPMVRALLAGTKTQTRRVVKGAPEDWSPVQPQVYAPTIVDRHGDEQPGPDAFGAGDEQGDHWIRCPYGQPGDRLYVRETWAAPHAYDHLPPRLIPTDARIHYAATEDRGGLLWRPSIHMPRWASRITLEVTGVKVERLQNISEADAIAEGTPGGHGAIPGYSYNATPTEHYKWLWESINGPGSWDANPHVWCVSFKRLGAA